MATEIPFVLVGAPAREPDLLYATGFDAPDPVAALRRPDGSVLLLVGRMELGRARRQVRGCAVESADTLGLPADRSAAATLAALLKRQGVRVVAAPPSLPLGAVEALRKAGVSVRAAARSPFAAARAVKTPDEIRKIARAQAAARAAERALGRAIRGAQVRASDRALLVDGRVFTSERARALVRETLLARGCMDLEGTIVAGGRQAADPHEAGHGPLRAGEWIVCDVFPRDLRTGYWGDMTRTFMRGRPSPALRRLRDTVAAAQKLGLSLVKPGAVGADVHRAVADFFRSRGYETGTDAAGRAHGFFHGLGHGVGLEIHEEPRLSLRGGTLEPGMVVTVEPGLYEPELGGVRIEDTVVVTETGCRIL